MAAINNYKDANLSLIYKNAQKYKIELTDQHLIIIYLLQDFYKKFNLLPSTRALINHIKNEEPDLQIDSILLFKLFPAGIAQICEIANLPKSPRCL